MQQMKKSCPIFLVGKDNFLMDLEQGWGWGWGLGESTGLATTPPPIFFAHLVNFMNYNDKRSKIKLKFHKYILKLLTNTEKAHTHVERFYKSMFQTP